MVKDVLLNAAEEKFVKYTIDKFRLQSDTYLQRLYLLC